MQADFQRHVAAEEDDLLWLGRCHECATHAALQGRDVGEEGRQVEAVGAGVSLGEADEEFGIDLGRAGETEAAAPAIGVGKASVVGIMCSRT
jgi:hypothetical protein